MIQRLSVRRRAPGAFAATFLAAALASTATALPESLDRVPTDALAVLVAPSLDRLDSNIGALLAAIEMPAVASPAQLLSVVGLSRGINTSRPFALAIMPGDLDAELPPALLLIPVSDYAAIAQSLGADGAGALAQGNAAGETIFIKKIPGDYAAISPLRSILERYSGDAGLLNAHRDAIGASGVSVVDKSDLALIANIPALAPMLAPGIDAMGAQLRNISAMQPNAGPAGMDNNPLDMVMRNFLRDGRTGVLGLRASGMGLAATVSANFKEGSELAGMFTDGGNSGQLLAKLPDLPEHPYIFAYAIDTSAPVTRTILDNTADLAAASATQQAQLPGLQSLRENLSGQSGMITKNPAGLIGGVLARGIHYYATPSPDEVVSGYRTAITALNGQSVAGLNYTGAFNPDSTQIAGRSASAYSIKAQSAPGSMSAPSMGMIYGPTGGPSGFLAKVSGGAVVTTQPDQKLMEAAMAAADGKGTNLAANRMLRQVQNNLPGNRLFEAYISPKPILDQLTPFLGMMGRELEPNAIPAELPPMGFSATAGDASMRFDAFFPAPVIRTGAMLAEMFQDMIPRGAGAPQGQPDDNAPPF